MSNTDSWAKRSETHRYSQDDRTKQWKYERELSKVVDPFIDNLNQSSLVIGQFDLEKEPWRMAAIMSFRKFSLKVVEKPAGDLVEVSLVKQKPRH